MSGFRNRFRQLMAAACLVAASAIGSHARAEVPPGLDKFDFREVIARSKDRVFPAVVYIKCVRQSHELGKKQSQEVSGSGVIISPAGELLTNWHVVDKAVEIRCLLYDGTAFPAMVVGADKDFDLALLRLQMPKEAPAVPCAELGDSSRLKEGDFVMAMGAPWGLARSVSIGIVSCTRRFLEDHSEYSLWLQTDASISPGNSGGPLVNTEGQVVGITTLAAMVGGDMGFAVPSSAIKEVLPRLREYGDVKWTWTGLRFQAIRDFDRNVYFGGTEGVIVASTAPDSPARAAGIQDRDRILRIGGVAVTALTEEDLPAIRRMTGLLPVGKPVTLEILRGAEKVSVVLTPRWKGKVEGEELDCPRWSLTVKAINQFDNPDLFFYRQEGVFIFGVANPGNAAVADLRPQDILVSIGNAQVTSLDDVKKAYARAMEGIATTSRIKVTILRGGLTRQVILDFSRDYERE